MTRIVKPFDWQNVTASVLAVIVEGLDEPGHTIALYDRHEYFHLPPGTRRVLARADCEPLPGRIARALVPVSDLWGLCVFEVLKPDGSVSLASGVKFGAGPVTAWVPFPPATAMEGFRYPVLLASCPIAHTPGQVNTPMPLSASLAALCRKAPRPGRSVVGAVQLSHPTAFDGRDSLVADLCTGTDQPEFAEALVHVAWQSCALYIARFRGAVIDVPSGFLMIDEGVWSDSTVTVFFNNGDLRQQPSLFKAHDQLGFLGGARDEREILAANGLDRFPGIPMPISNVGYRNHAHWVLNSLLAAWYARDAVKAGQVCLVVPEHGDYIVATLLAIGIPRAAVLVAPKGFYAMTDVLFPSTLSTHVNRGIPLDAIAMFDAVRRHCQARTATRGPRLVYLTRQGSGTQRKIANEDALIAALVSRGFVPIAPHELTFEQEVACVADADVIVGQLGAAMVNAAFAPRTAWLVEIASHNYVANDYWVLATTLGQRFVRLLCRAPVADKLTLTDFSFDVPLEETLAAIDRVCQAAAARNRSN